MATTAGLSENSHQGFEGIKAALCLAEIEAKPNVASGMRACLRPDGTGSRCTGKERDGGFSGRLDYFGARYYHSGFSMSDEAQRWISPDPVTDHIYDPESLNKYSYVRNDPVNLVDVDGRFYIQPPPPPDPSPPSDLFFEGQIWLFFRTMGWPTGPIPVSSDKERPDPAERMRFKRRAFLAGVLGENNKNVLDRIVGGCATFIDAMIKQLQPSYAYPSAHDWASRQLKNTVTWDYFGKNTYSSLGSGGSYARTEGNTIYLGENFFDDTKHDDVLTIIHEEFHLSAVSSDGTNLTHLQLLGLAEKAGYTTSGSMSPEVLWNNLMSTECGKK